MDESILLGKACRLIIAVGTLANSGLFHFSALYVVPMSDNTTFVHEDPWRIFRIMAEFVDSFQIMSQVGPAVTIFGSARTKPNDKY